MDHGQFDQAQFDKVRSGKGFIAALDQSGGSTPKALATYGIASDAFSNDDEMFDLIHQMRSRIITSPVFNGDRVVGAILFENTLDRQIEGKSSADYLWNDKGVVPFLKVDKGLADEADGVQLMKPIDGLDELLAKAKQQPVFGTKMRSVVKLADPKGIDAILDQQFEVGRQILDAGLMPILEPEIDINSPQKAEAENLMVAGIMARLDALADDRPLMFKLTLPDTDDLYLPVVQHARTLKVVALSGGYSREEANAKLARNQGVIASFSRAFTEGLSAQQTDEEFNATLDQSIATIYEASVA